MPPSNLYVILYLSSMNPIITSEANSAFSKASTASDFIYFLDYIPMDLVASLKTRYLVFVP